MNTEQQKVLDALHELTEDDALEVIAQWFADTGRNPDLLADEIEARLGAEDE